MGVGGGGRVWEGGTSTKVSDFFYKESKPKKI